jgi:hypothetical protein
MVVNPAKLSDGHSDWPESFPNTSQQRQLNFKSVKAIQVSESIPSSANAAFRAAHAD